MNKNQYRFTPQKSTNDSSMTVKNVVADGLIAEDVVVIVSLDVKGVFMPPGGP